ncbi:hypothetical protein BC835DRAFT_1414308 [Cytidiella melzeri]|nr:hypothetical protein BC835DRAFT_1414308 [Cytidiella melzeri]
MTQLAVQEGKDPAPLYVNAFTDVRQTLMALAINYQNGMKNSVVQDPKHEKCGGNIRIIDIYKIDDKTPLLLLLYQSVTAANPTPGIRWIQEICSRQAKHVMPNINASVLEQKLMLTILDMNSKRLSPDTVFVDRMESEKDFKLSFLLPIGPLTFEDIGKLNLNTGCVVCGGDTASRCSQCQSVSYCGKECQRADWPSHKGMCRSLKDGTWHTIPMTTMMPGTTPGMVGTTFNRRDFGQSVPEAKVLDDTIPPQNVHGDKLFLIKMQTNRRPGEGHALIYDRQRSFTTYFRESRAPAVFKKFKEEIEGPRGGHFGGGMFKMYRWAKWIGDWELSVCLDKEPQADIIW